MELLTPDRVITGAAHEVIEGGAVLVDGSGILAVGPAAQVTSRPEAAGASVRDLSGQTLLPGLIDCHVHLGFDASEAPVAHMMAASDHQLLVEMLRNARRLLAAGVTTARELGARGLLDLVVQEAIEEGKAPGPRLLVSNQPITVTGGHCWFMGCERDDHDGLRRAVREHHKAGAQVIKVMATGGFMTAGSAPWHAQFGPDELRVIVEEARRLGKRVAAHAHGLTGIRNSVAAGVDTIEHCSWAAETGENFDEEVAAAIVDKGIFVCPTANVHLLRPRGFHWAAIRCGGTDTAAQGAVAADAADGRSPSGRHRRRNQPRGARRVRLRPGGPGRQRHAVRGGHRVRHQPGRPGVRPGRHHRHRGTGEGRGSGRRAG